MQITVNSDALYNTHLIVILAIIMIQLLLLPLLLPLLLLLLMMMMMMMMMARCMIDDIDDDEDDNADVIDHGNYDNGDTDGYCHTFCFVCKPRPRDGVTIRSSNGIRLRNGNNLMAMCRV